jgi:DNA invertase Pin-like site-specific DNA recombinase
MITAIAYLRTSKEDQRLGPAAQRAAIEEYAAQAGVRVLEYYTEHVSGAALLAKRPVLLDALRALTNRDADLFLVAKRDRIARNVLTSLTVQQEIEQAGAQLIAVSEPYLETQTPQGRFMATILDAVAELERSLISERTTRALAVKRERGEKMCGPVSKLDAQDHLRIRERFSSGALVRAELAREYGVSYSTIYEITRDLRANSAR